MSNLGAEDIVARADQWTFEGDCVLLEFMKKISHVVEKHASFSSEQLQELTAKLKNTTTALDNAASSLTALQYTKFVESRCHDDDYETIPSHSSVMPLSSNDSNVDGDILKMFLAKNLEMLNKCHERYVLDFDDTDDEEPINNYIYKPKNPYNDRLLPHIFGSKLWKEQWHVGIGGDSAEYSGDEVSETFSESPTTTDDSESYESNSGNLSEWASSISILNDNSATKIAVDNGSSLQRSQQLTARHQIAHARPKQQADTDSDTNSAVSIPKAHIQRLKENDFFETVPDTPKTSKEFTSSPKPNVCNLPTEKDRSSASNSSGSVSNRNVTQLEREHISSQKDIFPETSSEQARSSSFVAAQPALRQIKRKPVNLFDDDDFNSFMSEIHDTVENKQNSSSESVRAKAAGTKLFDGESSKSVNCLASLDGEPISSISSSRLPKEMEKDTIKDRKMKKTPLNLFESPNSSPTRKPHFVTSTEDKGGNAKIDKTKITAKTLFDDDDEDDDDFLNVFTSKKVSFPTPNEKRLFFDSDDLLNEDTTTSSSGTLMVSKGNDDDCIHSDGVAKKTPTELRNTQILLETDNTQCVNKFTPTSDIFKNFDRKEVDNESLEKQEKLKVYLEEDDLFDKLPVAWKETKPHESALENETNNADYKETINSEPTEKPDFFKSIEENEYAVGHNIPTIANIMEDESSVIDVSTIDTVNEYEGRSLPKDSPLKPPTAISYGSIFLDEPPDDDDFFQALGNKQFASSKLVVDSEHDFIDSGLNKASESLKEQSKLDAVTIGDYGSLRLFSDVPPDDDEVSEISATETKQLHSVFYDDFSETIEALRTSNESKMPIHLMFDSEPPPDVDQFDIVSQLNKSIVQPVQVDNVLAPQINATQGRKDKDELDFQQPYFAPVTEEVIHDQQSSLSAKTTKSISKLKTPLININVHSLLPSMSTKLHFKKATEIKTDVFGAKENESTSVKEISEPKVAQNSNIKTNILHSVCKDRVRAPANRRPSTRKARQENYQKSFAIKLADDDEITAQDTSGITTFESRGTQSINEEMQHKLEASQREQVLDERAFNSSECFQGSNAAEDVANKKNNLQPKLVENEDAPKQSDGSERTPVALTSALTTPTNMLLEYESDAEDDLFGRKVAGPFNERMRISVAKTPMDISSVTRSRSLFADEQSDSDEDLFKNTQTSKVVNTATPPSKDVITQKASQPNDFGKLDELFNSDNDYDDNIDFLASLKKTKAPAKDSATALKVNSKPGLFSDIESDDENDLFGGSKDTHDASTSRTNKQPRKQVNSNRSTQQSEKPGTTISTQSDNPLADLLNS